MSSMHKKEPKTSAYTVLLFSLFRVRSIEVQMHPVTILHVLLLFAKGLLTAASALHLPDRRLIKGCRGDLRAGMDGPSMDCGLTILAAKLRRCF